MGCTVKTPAYSIPISSQLATQSLFPNVPPEMFPIAPGGTLSDYIPFYFTPFSMMMYNIHTGYGGIRCVRNGDIVMMVTSLLKLAEQRVPAVYTDRHAYLRTACFFSSLNDIDMIDWPLLRARDFRRDDEDPEKTDRYQAEALVHSHLPVELLSGVVCHGEAQRTCVQRHVDEVGVDLTVVAKPNWYF